MVKVKNTTILIVDDHENDRAFLEQLLIAHNYQVLQASDGDGALEFLGAHNIDLVVSDVLMPVMDGLQLCRIMKTREKWKNIPIILYTSVYSNSEDMQHAIQAGADGYIVKPVDPEELLERIAQVIKNGATQVSVADNDTLNSITENREKYLRLYSSQLVQRLEQEVRNLAIEIEKREKVEQELQRSHERLLLFRQFSPLAIIEWNADFQVVDWNTAAEKTFGYRLDEVKGRAALDFLWPKDSTSQITNLWNKLTSHAGDRAGSGENITKSGNTIICEWFNTPLSDEKGQVTGATSIILDVTAERQARQLLLEKENEQREILNSMVDAVVTVNETGKILSFNKAAEYLFGYSIDEILGENINRLVPKLFSGHDDSHIQCYTSPGDAQSDSNTIGREMEGIRKNNVSFPMRFMVAELPKDTQGKRRFIATCFDLTILKQHEEQLQRSQKMDALGKLTGGIAHDYNNMLGIIMGYADLLESALSDKPNLANYAHEIYRASERGAKLTRKILAFSRQKRSVSAQLNINTLLQDEQNMLEKTLTARIKLVLNLADNLYPVWLDSGDLEDAILNLSINAMHAMNGSGTLTIQTRNINIKEREAQLLQLTPGDYVSLSITDTGCGMDDVTRDKIFDPFFTTKGENGTGLGLSQVYGFVELSGGSIKVYSNPGHGSQFILYFPRYKQQDSTTSSHNANNSSKDYQGNETILVVDDESALLNLTTKSLNQQGYKIYSASNGQQAMKILEQQRIDLLLSDVIMPDMDGYELAALVRQKYPATKIQLASGFNDDTHSDMIDERLHQNLLLKPFHSQSLYKRIRELLDTQQ